MRDYPSIPTPVNHVEPVPRRIRGMLAGETIFDTTRALYVWEFPPYPQYYIPLDDVRDGVLVDEDHPQTLSRGRTRLHGLRAGGVEVASAARVYVESTIEGVAGRVRFEWPALDAWFEEDERVFVHPRNPYARVDALRSRRSVRVELDGVLLAETSAPVLLFETGLPTRYYINYADVDFAHLVPTDTETACPYKGTTGGYWSARIGDVVYEDLAWTYDFPTRQCLSIAGMIAFYNERVDITLDGVALERPKTHFA